MEDKNLENLLKIILAGGSLTAGAFLTALRSKLASSKKKNLLHVSFYLVAAFVIISVLVTSYMYKSIIFEPYWFAIIVMIVALVSSFALIWVTHRFLTWKSQYSSKELDPVVNKFSVNADKDNIKFLAGNLDFLGTSAQQIDSHLQYKCLREMSFSRIQVLCKPPISNEDKMRYGKIISDFPAIELRYYNPPIADLKVRGRIKTLNNVTRLLIYNKVLHDQYEALELDTAETDGARYTHLWNLIWEIASVPTPIQLNEYRNFYRTQN